MKEINNKEKFREIIQSPDPVVIIFYKSTCKSCSLYFYGLQKYNTDFFYKIDVDDTDSEFYYKSVKMRMFLPDTRIYQSGELISSQTGILYDTQIKRLLETIRNRKNDL